MMAEGLCVLCLFAQMADSSNRVSGGGVFGLPVAWRGRDLGQGPAEVDPGVWKQMHDFVPTIILTMCARIQGVQKVHRRAALEGPD